MRNEQYLYADVVIKSRALDNCRKEFEKLTDQDALTYVAKNAENSGIGELAVGKINDQSLLADIAKNAKGMSQVHDAAVEKISDQSLLADIAKNTDREYTGEKAVNKLTDPSLIADVAKNAINSYVREAADIKLPIEDSAHQKALADSAKKIDFDREVHESSNIRRAESAIRELKDRVLLADVAKNAVYHQVRRVAREKLQRFKD